MDLPRFEFKFKAVATDSDLQRKANLRLVELLTLAPPGAKAVGVVERENQHYVSTIEVRSAYWSFIKTAIGVTPHSAVNRAIERLEDSIYRWRYGGGPQGAEVEANFNLNRLQTQ